MYRLYLLAWCFIIQLSLLSLTHKKFLHADDTASIDSREVIGCAPPSKQIDIFKSPGRKMVPLPGWGNHQWKIGTSNDSAQFYFNQGLNLFYSFHMDEAKASFQEAQLHDDKCAMAYWGETMAAGPFINFRGYNPNDSASIVAIEKAGSLAKNDLEKAIISAQRLRFTTDKKVDMNQMMSSYMQAMKTIYEQNKNNSGLAVLYADALMLIHPRDWYDPKGVEKEGTKEIIELLERILTQDPNHPAALHYYIHMVEPSATPQRAKDAADRLMPLLPSVAHMVHMPSHIYVRTGDYSKGILSNEKAIAGYSSYKQILKGWEGNRFLYLYHNADMQGTNAMMMGNYKLAKKSFQQNIDQFDIHDTSSYSTPMFSSYSQFLTVQSYLTEVRFGNWEKVLNEKKPISDHAFHKILWLFGQGMALVATDKINDATETLNKMKVLSNDSLLYARRPNRNGAIDAVYIAELLLEGRILMQQKNWIGAIEKFTAAITAEDNLRYSEPEDWRIPSRQFLGQSYLLKGDYLLAQKTFEEDLLKHPNNFWALNGLNDAFKKQKNLKASAALVKQYNQIFANADIKLYGAVY